jgi:hypothetical protein
MNKMQVSDKVYKVVALEETFQLCKGKTYEVIQDYEDACMWRVLGLDSLDNAWYKNRFSEPHLELTQDTQMTIVNTKESLAAMATKIAELQAEHEKLVASLKAEGESNNSLLQKGNWCIASDGAKSSVGFYSAESTSATLNSNSFQNQTVADKYVKAFDTMLALRHCKGSVKAVNGVNQWLVNSVGDVRGYYDTFYKDALSCVFNTYKDACNAIETVGKQNIIDMYATMNGSGL